MWTEHIESIYTHVNLTLLLKKIVVSFQIYNMYNISFEGEGKS